VQAARGDLDEATTTLEEALRERPPAEPFEEGRSWLVLGMVHRRARRRAASRDALRRAHDRFRELGADLWAQRARAELVRAGGTSDPAEAADGLTVTERRVAELIAAGRTYRQAADELFISPKTVQTHLSNVYRKLGIRSRAELPGRLPRPD
jgi:DNA-binding CsgD family transcriptional regulator